MSNSRFYKKRHPYSLFSLRPRIEWTDIVAKLNLIYFNNNNDDDDNANDNYNNSGSLLADLQEITFSPVCTSLKEKNSTNNRRYLSFASGIDYVVG